jgi:hypothetical protein
MSSFHSLRLLACDLGVTVKGKRFDFDRKTINLGNDMTDDDIEPLFANLGRFKCLTEIRLVRVVKGGGMGCWGDLGRGCEIFCWV